MHSACAELSFLQKGAKEPCTIHDYFYFAEFFMYDMEKHHLESSLVYSSTRPLPELALESPFSQRKRTPFRAPGPPNTCPPVSRIRQFRTPETQCGPQAVSFKHERKQDSK